MPFESIPMIAGGDIRPSRFVKISTAADNTVLEADANEKCFGIATEATQDAPLAGADGDAAEATDQVMIHPPGSMCQLTIGSAGVTRGDRIKSDSDGKGVVCAVVGTTNQEIGAEALESALENELCWVRVVSYPYMPA